MGPLLFLDIDGVLVTRATLTKGTKLLPGHKWSFHQFDPQTVGALNRITDETGATIVISSTWRKGRTLMQLREILADQGVTGRVIDKTGNSEDGIRGGEIQRFMTDMGIEPHEIVILDDDADMLHLTPRLIQTRSQTGLTMEDAQAAIDLLAGRRPEGTLHTPWEDGRPQARA